MIKKSKLFLIFILSMFLMLTGTSFHNDKVKASAYYHPSIIKTYQPISNKAITTEKLIGTPKLVFSSDGKYFVSIFKVPKNTVLRVYKIISFKMPSSSKKFYFVYIKGNGFSGYVPNEGIKAYNQTSVLTDIRNSGKVNTNNTNTATNTNNTSSTSNASSGTVKSNSTLENAFENDLVTSQSEVNGVPWEHSGNYYFIEPLYDSRDIYYHINSTGAFAAAWQKAIDAWNALGVVQFVSTNNTDNDHVLMLNTSNSVPNTSLGGNWAGLTTDNANYATNTHQSGDLVYTNCYLNPDYILKNNSSSSQYSAMVCAEHELGHVLGFDHDPRTYGTSSSRSLMNAGGSNTKQNPVGAKEQYALIKYYNLNILPNHFAYPCFDFDETSNNGQNIQMSSDYPIKDKIYDYRTNTYQN